MKKVLNVTGASRRPDQRFKRFSFFRWFVGIRLHCFGLVIRLLSFSMNFKWLIKAWDGFQYFLHVWEYSVFRPAPLAEILLKIRENAKSFTNNVILVSLKSLKFDNCGKGVYAPTCWTHKSRRISKHELRNFEHLKLWNLKCWNFEALQL